MTDCGNGNFCCVPAGSVSGYNCCDSTFKLGTVHNLTTIGLAQASTAVISSNTTSSSLPTTVTGKPSSSPALITSTSPTTTHAPQSSTSLSVGPTATQYPSQNAPSPQLSTGAKAGIGVGAGLGVVLLIAAILLFWRRRRTALSQDNSVSKEYTYTGQHPAEMPNYQQVPNPTSNIYELSNPPFRAHEMPESTSRVYGQD
jgi:hypothetical protein